MPGNSDGDDGGNAARAEEAILDLRVLSEGLRNALTPAVGSFWSEAATVCLIERGHVTGCLFRVSGFLSAELAIRWGELDSAAANSWRDLNEAAEYGAMAIACLVIELLTDLRVVARSPIGTGCDIWLSDELPTDPLVLVAPEPRARLEVSGIRRGGPSTVDARVRFKMGQAAKPGGLPATVIVVEFGTPLCETREV